MLWLVCWLWVQQPVDPAFRDLDPKRFVLHPIAGAYSATSLVRVGDEWFVTLGLPDARPGLYRLVYRAPAPVEATSRSRREELSLGEVRVRAAVKSLHHEAVADDNTGFVVVPVKPTMQEDLRGVQPWGDADTLALVSSRRFDRELDAWQGRLMLVNRHYWFMQEVITLPESPICLNKSYDCGAAAAVWLAADRMLIFRDQDPSQVTLLVKRADVWLEQRTWKLAVERRSLSIGEVRLRGETLYLLLRKRRQIGAVSLKTLLASEAPRVQVTPVFDFSFLKREITSSNLQFRYSGLAEGFDWDQDGNLFVLLNSHGFPFLKLPMGEKNNPENRLLIFTKPAQTKPATSAEVPKP